MGKKYMKKKNMMYSILAVLLVVLLVPAALGVLHSTNDAIAAEYVTTYDGQEAYKSYSALTAGGSTVSAAALLVGYNSTDVYKYLDQGPGIFYDTNETVDTMFIDMNGETLTAKTIYYNLNYTVDQLYDNSTSRLYVYYSTSQTAVENVTLYLRSAEYNSGDTGTQAYSTVFSETISPVNGSYSGYVDIATADLLRVMSDDSSYDISHLSVVIVYSDSGDTFVDGEQIDFQFTFEGQRGLSESAATPFIVGGLGAVLLIAAAASTDIIDPTSPYHVINNPFKKKRAPRRRKSAKRRKTTKRRR